jgi:hypothetical protein
LLNEFTNPEMRSRSLVVQYYRSHRDIYDAMMDFFNQLTADFEEQRVLGQVRDITVQRASLDRARGHFARMAESAAVDAANFHRDMARFFQEWDLTPAAQQARR